MNRILLLLPLLVACAMPDDTDSFVVRPVESPAGEGAGEVELFSDGSGRVYMSWLEPAGSEAHALRFAVLENGAWSAPRTIHRSDRFFVNWADFPSILALPDGRLAAHWLEREGEATYAYGVRVAVSRDRGTTWDAPVTPHRDGTETEHGFVSLVTGDSLGIVWLDGRRYATATSEAGREMELRYTTLAPDGSTGAEQVIDQRVCDCCQTSVAVSNGALTVAYRDRSAGEIRDIAVSRKTGDGWSPAQIVHDDGWHIAACPVNGPAIAADGARTAVAWFTAAKDSARVLVAFSEDGRRFAAPIRVDRGAPAGRVDLALQDDGSAIVSWIERTGGDSAVVMLRRVGADGTVHDAQGIASTSAGRASGFPRITRSGNDVIIAWTAPGVAQGRSTVHVARLTAGRRGE